MSANCIEAKCRHVCNLCELEIHSEGKVLNLLETTRIGLYKHIHVNAVNFLEPCDYLDLDIACDIFEAISYERMRRRHNNFPILLDFPKYSD